jgi:protoheme ferro-lyase
VHTERQANLLRGYLGEKLKQPHVVDYAMRYGKPSIEERIHAMVAGGCDRILVVPLYPQYSATTTASIFERVTRELARWRWVPELRMVNQYWEEESDGEPWIRLKTVAAAIHRQDLIGLTGLALLHPDQEWRREAYPWPDGSGDALAPALA